MHCDDLEVAERQVGVLKGEGRLGTLDRLDNKDMVPYHYPPPMNDLKLHLRFSSCRLVMDVRDRLICRQRFTH